MIGDCVWIRATHCLGDLGSSGKNGVFNPIEVNTLHEHFKVHRRLLNE
jgi:hypothetical protein